MNSPEARIIAGVAGGDKGREVLKGVNDKINDASGNPSVVGDNKNF